MSNKAIDKEYLLRQLKKFEEDIIADEYQEKLDLATSENNGLMSSTDKIKIDGLPFSIVDGKLCITYYEELSV